MLIASGNLKPDTLSGKVALVTGAGGGIGYEAARALIWLGAKVIIAEINQENGKQAEQNLNQEFGDGSALFIPTDVGDEGDINKLKTQAIKHFKKVDIVINNATVAPLGPVVDMDAADWDASYQVNLRAPALLARTFLPDMIARSDGVFMGVSSLGQEYMAAYEAMKAAQVHLTTTLAAELEGTGVYAFSIGPGFVPTKTAESSIPPLAKLMGISAEELFEIVKEFEIPIEAAGAGFAAAAVLAERYTGQEISSSQALMDAGIELQDTSPNKKPSAKLSANQFKGAFELCNRVRTTLAEQSAGWKERTVFERQWNKRTLKSRSSLPVEGWLEGLAALEKALEIQDMAGVAGNKLPLDKLAAYYDYLHEMAKGYIKDPVEREEHLAIVRSWQKDVEELGKLLNG